MYESRHDSYVIKNVTYIYFFPQVDIITVEFKYVPHYHMHLQIYSAQAFRSLPVIGDDM